MRFPPEFIERLRMHLPISQVIGKRIALRKHGREFQACCPFHKEKTPSFTVNDDKGFYHCFGCAAHGDAIGFIKDYEGISYPEAVQRLAAEAGLPLPETTREAQAAERKRHTLEEVMLIASRWFCEQLLSPAGREARDYLARRGLQPDTIQRFELGYAPNNREALQLHLSKHNVPRTAMLEAGLLAKTDDGNLYDRFRGRLMFPIKSQHGKIIAFGGRILPSVQTDKTAKYLNSPETPLFKKGENLFAFHIARSASRDKGTLIVAEGYMDVIALHQAGFSHAVAPLGTALTEEQLKLLWRTTPEPILCLDGDNAGKRAMLRAAEMALPYLKAGQSLRFVFLPSGQDPDSFIKEQGGNAMQKLLQQSQLLSETIWEDAAARFGLTSPEHRAALEHHLTQCATRITDKTMSQHMLRFFRDQLYSSRPPGQPRANSASNTVSPKALPEANAHESHIKSIENQLVSIILTAPSLLSHPETEEQFASAELTQSSLDKLRAAILEIHADSMSLDASTLRDALGMRGYAEKVDTLLRSGNLVSSSLVQNRMINDSTFAAQSFDLAYHAYLYQKTLQERHEAEQLLTQSMTEETYKRFIALDEQCESLRRKRYSFAPDEQFS